MPVVKRRMINYRDYLASLPKRDSEIRKLRKKGWKIDDLAEKFGVTKQRVSQIANGAKRAA